MIRATSIAQESPLNRPQVEQGIDFDFNTDRNAIGRNKIKTFNFSSGFGGTLTLGGTANGNGVMQVLNSAGGTVVTVNNTGISVTGGSITVVNSAGSTILDPTGLVSTANFMNDSAFNGAAGLSTNSTSFQDVTGSGIGTITTDRTLRVMVYIMGYGYNNNAIQSDGSANVEVQMYDNNLAQGVMNSYVQGVLTTNVTDLGTALQFGENTLDGITTRASILDVEAGTHSYKMQYRAMNSGTAYLSAWALGYIILGS